MSIVVENLSYDYDHGTPFETRALQSVDFEIREDSICAVMGKTGCGKSTLIQLIAGLYEPADGRIIIDGEDINDTSYDRLSLRKKLGIVFQYPESQLFETTAYKDVAFGLKHSGLSDEEKDENIRWALKATGFDFDTIKDQSPLGLSGGEKRRLAIAGVLAIRPKYLILDEPIAGLDPEGRERFLGLLKELNQNGVTIIIVTHNAEAVAACAKDVLILKEGKVADFGEVHKVFRKRQLLKECGIKPGFPAWISDMLKERGLLEENDAITIEELMPLIREALLKKGGKERI